MKKLMTVLLLLMITAVCAAAETITASPDGISLTEALAMARDGDVIELADGVYAEPSESYPIIIDKAVTIRAAEGANPVIRGAAMKSTLRVEADGVTLRGLSIEMLRHGIYAVGDRMTVEGCCISLADESWRTSSCGVWMGGVKDCVFRDCAFTGCAIALAGPPLSESTPNVPKLTGMFEVGEDIEFFTTHTIEDCTVNGKPLCYCVNERDVTIPADAGCILVFNCNGVTVDGADVSYSSMGAEILYCSDVTVRNTTASYCGIFGIYLAKNPDGLVENCYVEGTNHGIDIRACTGVVTKNCRAYACDQGIFYSFVTDGLVTGCTVEATGQGYFFAAGTGCQISDCQVVSCENGMNIQKEKNVLITRCTFTGNTICAARLDGSDTIFTDNTMADNWVDVMAYGMVPFSIIGNRMTGCQSCSLYLRDIAYSRITGNRIEGPIQALGELSNSLLSGNTLTETLQYKGSSVMHEVDNQIIP